MLALLRSGARRTDEIAVLSGAHGPLAEVVALARRAGVKVSYRTRDQLSAIAGSDDHQGVVARVAAAEYVTVDDLLAVPASRGEATFLLALDRVQDPRNFGAVLRTAEVFGVHGVIVPKHHQVGLTEVSSVAGTTRRRSTRCGIWCGPARSPTTRLPPCGPVPETGRPIGGRRPTAWPGRGSGR